MLPSRRLYKGRKPSPSAPFPPPPPRLRRTLAAARARRSNLLRRAIPTSPKPPPPPRLRRRHRTSERNLGVTFVSPEELPSAVAVKPEAPPPLLPRRRPPPSSSTTRTYLFRFAITRATRLYHPPSPAITVAPLPVDPAPPPPLPVLLTWTPGHLPRHPFAPACQPRGRRVSATRAGPPAQPDQIWMARWTWSTVGRVPDVWAPHVRISFNYLFRLILGLTSC